MSRGLRNNNPGNIEKNSTKWKGLSKNQTDSRFFKFESMAWGYRAMFRTLRTYKSVHGKKTLTDMISRWAPPIENNTEGYIRLVSNRAKVYPNVEIDTENKALMCRIVEAMSYQENGVPANLAEVEAGWNLL